MTRHEPDPERRLPLKPVEFHVLLVLTEGALHGYGIVRKIEVHSEGRLRVEPGNLYRHLRRLVEDGLVEPAERRPVGDTGDERRRYFCITAFGRRVLAADAARMRRLAAAVEATSPRTSEGR